jgi:hypothetical protein
MKIATTGTRRKRNEVERWKTWQKVDRKASDFEAFNLLHRRNYFDD